MRTMYLLPYSDRTFKGLCLYLLQCMEAENKKGLFSASPVRVRTRGAYSQSGRIERVLEFAVLSLEE